MSNTKTCKTQTDKRLNEHSRRRDYFGLEIGRVAEGMTVLISLWLGGSWSGTACEIQALLWDLWESLCFHYLIKQPLSSFQSCYLGENSCYRLMCKALFMYGYKTLSEGRWKSAEQSALKEKGKEELQTIFHSSLTWGEGLETHSLSSFTQSNKCYLLLQYFQWVSKLLSLPFVPACSLSLLRTRWIS